MNLDELPRNWVDFLVLLLIVAGLVHGRKRGMSVEILDILQWLVILVAAGYSYQPLGRMLSEATIFSALFCYVAVYLLLVLSLKLLFGVIRRKVGDKLVSADVFGGGEYYMGMFMGAARYLSILLVGLALLNARLYTPEEKRAEAQFQEDNFGSIRFPTLCTTQGAIFDGSLTGYLAQKYLPMLLITPTAPNTKDFRSNNIVRARERQVEETLEK